MASSACAATSTATKGGGGCHPARRSASAHSSAVSFETTAAPARLFTAFAAAPEMNAPSVGKTDTSQGNGDDATPLRPSPALNAAEGQGTTTAASNAFASDASYALAYGFASFAPIHRAAGTHPSELASANHRSASASSPFPEPTPVVRPVTDPGLAVSVHPGGKPCMRSASCTSMGASAPSGVNAHDPALGWNPSATSE